MRKWYKVIPPKKAQEVMNLYHGIWMPYMDRCWESDDGYSVMSRQIRTDWGIMEHVTIHDGRKRDNNEEVVDIPWAVKQEIKNELFGIRSTAIEVFPDKKHLVDICDVYHIWILPKDFVLPFGIHPVRDVQVENIERGYDFNIEYCSAWVNSPERKAIWGPDITIEEFEQEHKTILEAAGAKAFMETLQEY